jgi:hypothetical protein
MTASEVSGLTAAFGGIQLGTAPTQCSAFKNGGTGRCHNTNCPVFIYDDIDTRLCSAHETYKRGAIFRQRFSDFETTALITNGQPDPTEPGQSAQDIRLVHHSGEDTVFTGAELDGKTKSSQQLQVKR